MGNNVIQHMMPKAKKNDVGLPVTSYTKIGVVGRIFVFFFFVQRLPNFFFSKLEMMLMYNIIVRTLSKPDIIKFILLK